MTKRILLIALFASVAFAQNETEYCAFPKPSRNLTVTCSSSDSNITDWTSYATQFAPVIDFHPLETMYLADPSTVFFQGSAFIPIYNTFANLSNPETAYTLIYDPTFRMFTIESYMTLVQNEDFEDLITGADFDASGNSKASIYYAIYEDNATGTVVFSYNMYYAATGCSNQLMAANASSVSDPMILNYVWCNLGVQEGNWQNIRVMVCPSTLEVVQIAYNQHSWNEIRDCTAGECEFDAFGHPKVYSALYSHASYGYQSDIIIYDQFSSLTGIIIDGIYLVDRTGNDSSKRFFPTDSNVLPLPSLGSITNGSTDVWAAWESPWTGPIDNSITDILCFEDSDTLTSNCSFSPLAVLIDEFIDVTSQDNSFIWNVFLNMVDDMTSVANQVSASSGPWTQSYNYFWTDLGSAPIYEETSNPQCPAALEWVAENGGNSAGSSITIVDAVPIKGYAHTIVQQVIAVLIVVIVVLFVMGSVLCLRSKNDFVEYERLAIDEDGESIEVPVASSAFIKRLVFFCILALAVGVTGMVLSVEGLNSLKSALEGLSQSNAWNTLLALYVMSLPIIILIDIVSLVTMLAVNTRRLAQDPMKVQKSKGHCWNALSISLLVLAIFISMFTFSFGMIMFSLQYILNQACHNISTRIVAVCVNLQSIGINLNFCGEDLFKVCNNWDSLNVPFLTWGPILFNISHIAFLMLNVMIFVGLLNFDSAYARGLKVAALEAAEADTEPQSEQELMAPRDKNLESSEVLPESDAAEPVAVHTEA
jgi:hypothetical protein